MEKIIFENLSVGGDCNLFHRGEVREYLKRKSFQFYRGNLYGLIGELGDGGAAFSCGITGNTDFDEGTIWIDDVECSIEQVIEKSWYVGNDLYKYNPKSLFGKKPRFHKDTIRQQIQVGIRSQNLDMDVDTIQQIFEISNERIDRNIEFVSGERWKASAAIGYANGKRIFCYPWMYTKDIKMLKEQMAKTVRCLLSNGCIVIIPTTKEENIKKINAKANIIIL